MKYYISGHIQSGIYKITNKINKKYYIGSAYDLYKRYKDHRSALEGNRHHNKQLTRFVNKYGIDNLEFDLLEECSIEELESREQYYITNSKNIFNETLDVKACNRGKKLSEEHKQNISNSIKAKNIIRSEETKTKISKANKGRTGKYERTEEQKQKARDKAINNSERSRKISEALKGRKNTWTTKHTEETKLKISKTKQSKNDNRTKYFK
jgi:group I intron endonuclease